MADTIMIARRHQDTMLNLLTRIEGDVVKLDEKEGLTLLDKRKIKRLKEKAKEHDRDFELCRVDVLHFIEAED